MQSAGLLRNGVSLLWLPSFLGFAFFVFTYGTGRMFWIKVCCSPSRLCLLSPVHPFPSVFLVLFFFFFFFFFFGSHRVVQISLSYRVVVNSFSAKNCSPPDSIDAGIQVGEQEGAKVGLVLLSNLDVSV
ncbi:hypothetical protein QBC45DRAFT_197077 [Copromyces sp. CBS 386.78]|nr:hypothetical protein QBC45DRAFT_197077 [Copromyces sp. CBS 386.78]